MLIIKLRGHFSTSEGHHRGGSVIEVDAAVGEHLIATGQADAAKGKPKAKGEPDMVDPETETADNPRRETADVRPGKGKKPKA